VCVHRNEIQNSGGEKGELSRKLKSIQEKVAEIESTHATDLEALQRKLACAENEANTRKMELNTAQAKYADAVSRCHELEASMGRNESAKTEWDGKIKSLENVIASRDATISKMQGRCGELERSESQLRDDKVQLEDIIKGLKGMHLSKSSGST
jgi:chromosome segregation ATPase